MSQHPRPLPPSSNPLQCVQHLKYVIKYISDLSLGSARILGSFSKILNPMAFVNFSAAQVLLQSSQILSSPSSSPLYIPPSSPPSSLPSRPFLKSIKQHPVFFALRTHGMWLSPPDDSTYFKAIIVASRLFRKQASPLCHLSIRPMPSWLFQSIDDVEELRGYGWR
ncbi:hypothetical protein B0H11DRAFT_1938769 [Mycena galericulata]|nr:hypothetical protein B0H11DRAFT_1938769 [Mycena galericulata]